ncbi:MAG: hypothetical protein IOC82_02065 [Aestuariivirga sp.]|uniref:hypothetical protein n=1 Tax=Aestuariivirga sp. TaxID=2650926 RepID=UPI0025C5F7DC|nr:hypothetical protein [Aestuariivirga sp.]MCA3559799.1 hypothetical protein [Aestuariivirga sp.]
MNVDARRLAPEAHFGNKNIVTPPGRILRRRGAIALAALRQMRKTRLVSAFEAHCVDHFGALKT